MQVLLFGIVQGVSSSHWAATFLRERRSRPGARSDKPYHRNDPTWSNLVRPKSSPTVAELPSPNLFFGVPPARWCSSTCGTASGPGLPRERLCHPRDSQIVQNSGISGIAGRAVHTTRIPRPPKLIQCRNSQNLEEGAVGEVHTRADSQSSEIAALRK